MYVVVARAPPAVHVECTCFNERREGRKKQAWSNKQQGKATQHTQGMYIHRCIILYSQAKKAYQIRKSLLTACQIRKSLLIACQIRMSLCAHCMPNKEVTYCRGFLCRFSFQRDSWNMTLTPFYTAVHPDTLHCQDGGGGGGEREGGEGRGREGEKGRRGGE